MTDEDHSAVREAIASHAAFESRDDRFEYVKTPFDATATIETADASSESYRVVVTVRVPTLGAVVAGETVADVVEDGWYNTFERRIGDAFSVARSVGDTVAVDRDGTNEEVVVVLSFETGGVGRAVEDAAALVEYVEGTYVQGTIPGYEYRDPVGSLLDRARQAATDSDGADKSDR